MCDNRIVPETPTPTTVKMPPPPDDLTFTNAPNLLTLLRIAFVPVVVGLMFLGDPTWDLVAALLFGVASATDYLDGYLARKNNLVTVYGKLMDPLADKFLVASSLIMLQELHRIHPVVVMLLVCREMGITGLRALASAEGVIIAASSEGKWKTATQMTAIPFLIGPQELFGLPTAYVARYVLYLSLGMSLWSAKAYVVNFFKALREKRKVKAAQKRLARQAKQAARAARAAAKAARNN